MFVYVQGCKGGWKWLMIVKRVLGGAAQGRKDIAVTIVTELWQEAHILEYVQVDTLLLAKSL